jgi:hypothetical protein
MKMILLMYLEGDEECVERLLKDIGVGMYSQMSMEGHSRGEAAGWYGESAPFRSRMVFAFMSKEQSDHVLAAVRSCTGVEDPRHPIRAFELDVARSAACGCDEDGTAD